MQKTFSALMALVLATPSIGMAGVYMGLGVGGNNTESTLSQLNLVPELGLGGVPSTPSNPSQPTPPGTDRDFASTDVSLDVTVGWMFNEHFGVEVGYIDFGNGTQNYTLNPACNTFGCETGEWTAEMQLSGFRAFLVGSVPVNKSLDAYLKVGAMDWKAQYLGYQTQTNVLSCGAPPVVDPDEPPPFFPVGVLNCSVSSDGDGIGLAAGMGINLKTDSPFSLHADLTYYDVSSTDLVWAAQLMLVYTY